MESMEKKEITVKEIIEIGNRDYNLKLKVKGGKSGLSNRVSSTLINRPGLTLSGYFKDFAYDRIQIFGRGESGYIKEIFKSKKNEIFTKFFSYKIPCCIFSYNQNPDKRLCNIADKNSIPLLVCSLPTGELIESLTHLLLEYLSPYKIFHGVLIEILGMGVLILGKSGVGKSECALELISKGHRLIADDVVLVKKYEGSILSGSGIGPTQHYMEIRGLGIIDIKSIFGSGSVRERKIIDMVVMLEEWNPNKEYDRIGLEKKYYNILGIEVPLLVIPVKSGRNIPVIIETAVKNERLKKMGIVAPFELEKKLFSQRKRRK